MKMALTDSGRRTDGCTDGLTDGQITGKHNAFAAYITNGGGVLTTLAEISVAVAALR